MWIGRTFHTGMIARQHTHETQILRRHGVLALLTIELRVAQSQMFEIGTWKAQPVTTYVGTSKQTAKVVTLDLTNMADATDRISMQCRTTTIAAAPPTAVRRATIPDHVEECGDEGRWQPRTTKRMTVLRCADDDSTSDDAPDLAFAPSPGIEWLYVNDDCLQGGGWRQVPADRSIVTKVRPGKKP